MTSFISHERVAFQAVVLAIHGDINYNSEPNSVLHDKLQIKADEAERQATLEWLSDIEYGLIHSYVSNRRQEGTSTWLLRHPAFEAWSTEGEKIRPSIENLNKLLTSEIERFQRVFIIIDALDERCVDDRTHFLKIIRSLPANAKIMITSRYLTSIEADLRGSKPLEIYANDDDVRTYVEFRIGQESRLQIHVLAKPQLKVEIIQTIVQSVRGMFLLAKLHMDTLSSKTTRKKVKDALEELSQSIHDTYDEAMKRIMRQVGDDPLLACEVLSWITKSYRPLTLLELWLALAIEPDMVDADEDALTEGEIIISVYGRLVTIEEESTVV